MLKIFGPLLTTYLPTHPLLTFAPEFLYCSGGKSAYLPRLVNVVCERPLAEHAGCSLTLARRTNPQFGPETSIKVTLAALQHCCTTALLH